MDFSSKKYLLLIVVTCIVFIIIIVKAYDYLPDKSVENSNPTINSPAQIVNNDQDNANNVQTQEQNYDHERHKSGHIDYMHTEAKNEYEEIKAPKGTYEEDIPTNVNNQSSSSLTSDEQAIRAIYNASKFKSSTEYSNALAELQKVPEYTNDKELLAESYQKIAEIYAVQKRYGTALSFAGKAYSTSPSSYRELLIARIYYQSGETDNAISRFNNLLRKGFVD